MEVSSGVYDKGASGKVGMGEVPLALGAYAVSVAVESS